MASRCLSKANRFCGERDKSKDRDFEVWGSYHGPRSLAVIHVFKTQANHDRFLGNSGQKADFGTSPFGMKKRIRPFSSQSQNSKAPALKYNSRLPGFSALPSISAFGLEGERISTQISGAIGQLACQRTCSA